MHRSHMATSRGFFCYLKGLYVWRVDAYSMTLLIFLMYSNISGDRQLVSSSVVLVRTALISLLEAVVQHLGSVVHTRILLRSSNDRHWAWLLWNVSCDTSKFLPHQSTCLLHTCSVAYAEGKVHHHSRGLICHFHPTLQNDHVSHLAVWALYGKFCQNETLPKREGQ